MTDEKPILFSAPLVRAILEGRKIETRRVIKPSWKRFLSFNDVNDRAAALEMCPYGAAGDELWVRETFFLDHVDYLTGPLPKAWPSEVDRRDLYFRADGECCDQVPECQCWDVGKPLWRPSIHMPRWASRIQLRINGVAIERLQEITEAGAAAEGIAAPVHGLERVSQRGLPKTRRMDFKKLWDSINGSRGFGWNQNPWVWALKFELLEQKEEADA